jgi:DNA repair exonuclease SbcCD ATPase subunit
VDLQEQIHIGSADKECLMQARDVMNAVMLVTQEQVKDIIEDIVTLCLQSVYGSNYGFRLSQKILRNKSEISPIILKDGVEFEPRDEVGGGVIDVASLGLRLAIWSLTKPKTASVFVLDEPFKFLHGAEYSTKAGEMVRELADMLQLQIILVSAEDSMIDIADKSFVVRQKKSISKVEEVGYFW